MKAAVQADIPLEEFFDYLTVEKGLAQNTLMAYRQDLSSYKNYLKTAKIRDFSQINRNHIMKYFGFLEAGV